MMSITYTKNFTCFNEENYIISCTISLNSSYITINTIDGKNLEIIKWIQKITKI